MIEELISRVFAARDCAHLQHWKTKSFAEHTATGDFYASVIDKIDGLVEAYQGNFGAVGAVKLKPAAGDLLKCLEADVVWIAQHRDHLVDGVAALANIVDDLVALYLTTIYKLKTFK